MTGAPLVRDCSCRSDDAGFAHLGCLVQNAKHKFEQRKAINRPHDPWNVCCICKQTYQGQLSIDMATAYVSYAERNFSPRFGELIFYALVLKLRKFVIIGTDEASFIGSSGAVQKGWSDKLDQTKREECKETAKKLASLVSKAKVVGTPLGHNDFLSEATAYRLLGDIALSEGGEHVRLAIAYYQKNLELCREHGLSRDDIDSAASCLARAKAVQAGENYVEPIRMTLEQLEHE